MQYVELLELACAALQIHEDERDDHMEDPEELDTMLREKLNTDLDTFGDIAKALLPLTPRLNMGVEDKVFHAFVEPIDSDGQYRSIVKKEVDD